MFKSIIKELAIIILLIIAIGIIFFIVFYDYNTVNTTVPKKMEAYELSTDIKEELNETLKSQDTQELVKTYILDESDLRRFEATNTYDKGKPNPFSKYTENNNSSGNQTGGNSTSSGGDTGKFTNSTKGK